MKRVLFLLLSNILCNIFLHAMDPIEVQTYAYFVQGKNRDHCEDAYTTKEITYNNNKYLCTGIFDGHSGDAVATLAQEKFFNFFEQKLQDNNSAVEECLRYACTQCEELTKAKEYENSGSTVLASCFDISKNRLSILWLGDSKAYVSNDLGNVIITSDHNCLDPKNEECARVQNAGGKIIEGKLNNMIAVTRSLGDSFAKTRISQLIAEPEYTWMSYSSDGGLHVNGFSIEASDGFWNAIISHDNEALNNYAINNILWNAINLSHQEFYYEEYPQFSDDNYESDLVSDEEKEDEVNIAQRLCYIAIEHFGSTDDTTVIVKLFGSNIFGEDSNSDKDSSRADKVDNLITNLQSLKFNQKDETDQPEQEIQKEQEDDDKKNDVTNPTSIVDNLISTLENLNLEQNKNDQQKQELLPNKPEQKLQNEQENDDQKNQKSPKLMLSANKNYKYFFTGLVGIMLVVLFVHYYYKHLNKNIRIYS